MLILIAYLIGVGDFVAFDLENATNDGLLILDCFHELSPENWEGICFGLKTWLEKMVQNQFRPFWLNQ